ncbi:MAG: ABC transporter permease [Pseudomonadota bacterium]
MNARAQWIAFRTILGKEVRRFMRIWIQTILPPAITTALYFIIFGGLIGPRVGEMGGFDFMDYIMPGLIMMAVINNSYANVVASFYGAKFQRSVEEMLVSPMPNFLILAGFVGGGVARGLIVGVAVTAVALFFTELRPVDPLLTLLVVLMTSVLFSLAGFVNAVYANSFDDISIIPTFVLTPLTYLGGVFFSITMLSEFWQQVSLANPILYMVNAFRAGMLGVSDVPVWVALGVILGFTVVLTVFCMWLLNRGVGIRG